MEFEGRPEGHNQRFAAFHGAFDRLPDGRAFIRHLAGIQRDEAADEARVGMIGLDVFAEEGHALLQVLDAVFGFEHDAVHGHNAVGGEVRDQAIHFLLLW